MKKTIRIGKQNSVEKQKTPGALRYEALTFLEKTEGSLAMWECRAWVNNLLNHLEDRFTPIRPSLSDRAALMVSIAGLVSDKPTADLPENIDGAAAYLAEAMGLDITGATELRWFDDSPNAGDPLCICSYCECLIEEAAVPIRFFGEDKREQRLHADCFQTCIDYGLIDPDGLPRI